MSTVTFANSLRSHTNLFWHESRTNRNHRFRRTPRLDLLGYPVNDFNPLQPRWINHVRISENPWLADYKRKDHVVLSPSSMICAVLEASRQLSDPQRDLGGFELRDVHFGECPVIPAADNGIGVFLQIGRHGSRSELTKSPWQEFILYSEQNDDKNVEHCSGLFQIHYRINSYENGVEDLAEAQAIADEYVGYRAMCKRAVTPEDFYGGWKSRNMHWGKTFPWLVVRR